MSSNAQSLSQMTTIRIDRTSEECNGFMKEDLTVDIGLTIRSTVSSWSRCSAQIAKSNIIAVYLRLYLILQMNYQTILFN